jgi:hypothetical protein
MNQRVMFLVLGHEFTTSSLCVLGTVTFFCKKGGTANSEQSVVQGQDQELETRS